MRVLMFALMCVAIVGLGYSYKRGDGYTLWALAVLAVVMVFLLIASYFVPL